MESCSVSIDVTLLHGGRYNEYDGIQALHIVVVHFGTQMSWLYV